MSFRVLAIPEDATHDGSIIKPLCERLLAECGKPNARIEVLREPSAKGYAHAKSLVRKAVFDLYPTMQLFLFLPDADGEQREGEFQSLEAEFHARASAAGKRTRLLCCAAVEEIEAWLLAGHSDKWLEGWNWTSIRADRSVKESYFRAFLEEHGQDKLLYPDEGRRQLMQEGLANYGAIRQRCPELAELEARIRDYLETLG